MSWWSFALIMAALYASIIGTTRLAAGQVEQVKSALKRLVGKIEVHAEELPGRKRPGAKLVVRGNLEALLTLTGKVTTGGSPGGIWAPLTFQFPARTIRLHVLRRGHASVAGEQWRETGRG